MVLVVFFTEAGTDDHKARPVGRHIFDTTRDDLKPIAHGCGVAGNRAFGTVTSRTNIASRASRVFVRHRLEPSVTRKEYAALCQRDRMTPHNTQLRQRRTRRGHQTKTNRDAHFAAVRNAITRGLQCRMGDVHDASNRVFEREHRKVCIAIDDLFNRVGERAARNRVRALGPMLSDRELAERAEFTLKCHAGRIGVGRGTCGVASRFKHVGKILTGVRQRPTLPS